MSIDIKAGTPSITLTPIVFLRWLACVVQLVVIMASMGGIGVPLPEKPLLFLVASSFVMNVFVMVAYKNKRVPEETVRLQLIFDIIQFSGILFFTGGTTNPFSILLLAPLAMAASLLSLFNLCLLIMLTLINLSIMAFAAHPLLWRAPAPFLSPEYHNSAWIALLIALVIISFIIWRLAMEGRRINEALNRTHAILEEKRRTTALGALAAAAVHELGSPLGTIAIITRELERELHPDDPFADDIMLLKNEAEKCKRILTDLARNPTKSLDKREYLRLDRLIIEIASTHTPENCEKTVKVLCDVPENLPQISKNANIEYGLGNLIGNALSYAQTCVSVRAEGSAEVVEVCIEDDGPGFPPHVLKAVGQPYISTRETVGAHMGLGIFIAMNLLEATGATLFFLNLPEKGAQIRIIWPRSALEAVASPV